MPDDEDQKALATIILSMADDQLIHVHGKVNAKQAWDSLQEMYTQPMACSLIVLTRKMYQTVMQPGDSVTGHLNALAECFQQLERRGKTLSEEDRVYVILSSLLEEFNKLITLQLGCP